MVAISSAAVGELGPLFPEPDRQIGPVDKLGNDVAEPVFGTAKIEAGTMWGWSSRARICASAR